VSSRKTPRRHHQRWSPGDGRLAPIASLKYASTLIEDYPATGTLQQQFKAQILEMCSFHRCLLDRDCMPGHLTASALVVNEDRSRVMLHHHAKLDRWLQFGGHCDGDANLPAVALRESIEESGVPDLSINPEIIDIDIHTIPQRKTVPEHLHLDIRFMVMASDHSQPMKSDESLEVCWYDVGDLNKIVLDQSVMRLVRIIC